jgi:rod shape determining protein RodA
MGPRADRSRVFQPAALRDHENCHHHHPGLTFQRKRAFSTYPAELLTFPAHGSFVVLIIKEPDQRPRCPAIHRHHCHSLLASAVRPCGARLADGGGGWFLLHDYQRERIHTFLDPERTRLAPAITSSSRRLLLAVAVFSARGLRRTQSQLFCLSAIPISPFGFCRRMGFVARLLQGFTCWSFSWESTSPGVLADRFGMHCPGCGCPALLAHRRQSGMADRPVAVVPLPLFSYGGRACYYHDRAGLPLNVGMRRFMF